MTWYPHHPGGVIVCDDPCCTASRINYCSSKERDEWVAFEEANRVLDLCPPHRAGRISSPRWLTQTVGAS